MSATDVRSSPSPSPVHLIVQADDLGYASVRDDGIIRAFTEGIVTGASLLVNGASASEAATRALTINLPLTLHLNLSEGDPVSTSADNQTNSLIDPATGKLRGKAGFRKAVSDGLVRIEDLEREIAAQVWRFAVLTGHFPTRADGHQHVHVHPVVAPIFGRVLAQLGVRETRVPCENYIPPWVQPPSRSQFYATISEEAKAARVVFEQHGLQTTDRFFGMTVMGDDMSVERIAEILKEIVQDQHHERAYTTCELMVHPGVALTAHMNTEEAGCGQGPDDFSCSLDREHELAIVTAAETKSLLKTLGVILVSNKGKPSTPSIAPTHPLSTAATLPSVLMLSPMGNATGNATTAMRLHRMLSDMGLVVYIVDPQVIQQPSDISHITQSMNISLIVALHAYRSGRLLVQVAQDSARSNVHVPSLIVVLGGTDVNCMLEGSTASDSVDENDEVARRTIIQQMLQLAHTVVAFTPDMKQRAVDACQNAMSQDININNNTNKLYTPITNTATMLENMDSIDRFASKFVCVPQGVCVETPSELREISLGFDVRTACGLPASSLILLFPCGLRPVKDPCFLFAAMAELHAINPLVFLVIIGPALDHEVTQQVMKASADPSRSGIVYHDAVPHKTLLAVMHEQQVTAVVNSSVSEGMSGALLEAIAARVPVIVRRNPGNCSLVEQNVTGFIFDTPQQFVSCVKELLSCAAHLETVVKSAYEMVVKRFSLDAERNSYADIIRSVISTQTKT